jgi:hypothetical protein
VDEMNASRRLTIWSRDASQPTDCSRRTRRARDRRLRRCSRAVDTHDLVVGNTKPFDGEREARIGPASWWLNPAAAAPTPASMSIRALVLEESCASGKTPEGRVEPPRIEPTDGEITITFEFRRRPGGQDCPSNPPFPVTIKLPEPLGGRVLLDGASKPPRDASGPPPG